MNPWLNGVPLTLLLVVLSACVAQPTAVDGKAPRDLNRWVDEQLVPYVVEQLSAHPKFKGEPLLLVSMKGADVQVEIDELTQHIRARLMDALLQAPGVNLVWQPAASPWRHHRRLDELQCGELRSVRYYVGLDVGLSSLDDALEVSLRALDPQERSWASGFHLAWRGQATPTQRRALSRYRKDDALRGLRPLPFTAEQPDLLAAYLAHNVSCLLRHRKTMDEVVIYAEHPVTETPPFFRTTLDLVDNYLTRFSEVQVTDDPKQANVILHTEVHSIHKNLYQVWAGIRNEQAKRYLPGTETEAYVDLEGLPAARTTARGSQAIVSPGPSKRRSILRSSERVVTRRSANPTITRRPLEPTINTGLSEPNFSTRPSRGLIPPRSSQRIISQGSSERGGFIPVRKYQRTRGNRVLMRSFQLLTPARTADCVTDDPWALGIRIVASGDRLPNGRCLAVELTVYRSARLFILGQNGQGQLTWIVPSPCDGSSHVGNFLEPGEIFHYPLPSRKTQKVALDDVPGEGWIYAIAIAETDSPPTSRKLVRHIATPMGLCEDQRFHQVSPSAWQAYLEALAEESDGRMEWQATRFRYGAY